MAKLTTNDATGKRDKFRIYQGENVADVSEDGELKTKETEATFMILVAQEILTQLKINNAYLQRIVGEKLTECDVEE